MIHEFRFVFAVLSINTHTHTWMHTRRGKTNNRKKMYKKNTHTNIQTNKSKKKLKENHWET